MSLKDIWSKEADRLAKLQKDDSNPQSASIVGFPEDRSLPPDIDSLLDEDTTFNFRVNSDLKKEFALICKRDHLSSASALKRYMTACVRIGVLK